ncbi:MAG: hypothetical protein Kow0092_28290 [Deferrisomatales bacterium]
MEPSMFPNRICWQGDREPWCDTFVALLQGVSDGVLLTDLEGVVRASNGAAEVLTGVPAARARGRTCRELLGCAEPDGCPLERTGPGNTWAEAACRGKREDGRAVLYRVRARHLRDRAGRPVGKIALFSESSLQDSLQKKMVAYERLASLGELATSLIHEVGNPVSVILGFARLLVHQEGDDPGGEIRERIFREAERCRTIVEQMLAYARSSTREPAPVPLELHSVAQETLGILRYRLQRRGVSSDIHWDSDVPLVQADPGEMKQVLLNLLLNALDAAPEGGSIHMRGRRLVREVTVGGDSLLRPLAEVVREDWAEIRVEDDGPGLGSGDPERFFAPFFTTKSGGGGLGLSVCRRIVEERGGTIRLENRSPGGACAVIELPAARSGADGSR